MRTAIPATKPINFLVIINASSLRRQISAAKQLGAKHEVDPRWVAGSHECDRWNRLRAQEWVASPFQGEGESEGPFPGSDTPHLGPLPSDKGRGEKAQPATLQRYGSSLAVAIMIAMMAMRSPMRVIPGVSRARVIVRIRLGIRVVRPLVYPYG